MNTSMVSFRAFLVNNRQVAASASDCHQAPPRTIKNHQEHHLCRSFRRKFLQFSCCLRWLVPHPGQGRASVSCREESLPPSQDALPRVGQEHSPTFLAVRFRQSGAGASLATRCERPRCVLKTENARKTRQKAAKTNHFPAKTGNFSVWIFGRANYSAFP